MNPGKAYVSVVSGPAKGLPSTLSSTGSQLFNSSTSSERACLPSGLGCRVMPCAPAAMHASAACRTLGRLPPRAFRMRATLLRLTLRFVIERSGMRQLGRQGSAKLVPGSKGKV